MAYRLIYGEFWSDPKIQEEMTPEDRYFYLYILTNPCTTMCGIYQITKKQMAFELGYSMESVNSLMERFIKHHKLIKYNSDTRELAIKNWGKYNLNKGGKPVIDCLNKELGLVKDKTLIDYVGKKVNSSTLKELYDSYNDTDNDSSNSKFNENSEKLSNNDGSNDTLDDTPNDTGAIQIQNTDTDTITNTDTITSSSTEEEEVKEVMKLCQLLSYKLKKVDAKVFIETFGIDLVKRALGIASTSTTFMNGEVKGYASYLGAVLKDLSKETKVIINNDNSKTRKPNFTQREYDFDELEKEWQDIWHNYRENNR